MTAGATLNLAGYLVVCAIVRYAPSHINNLKGLTAAGCLQYWRHRPPGAVLELLCSLFNYALHDLFDPLLVQLLIIQAIGPLDRR